MVKAPVSRREQIREKLWRGLLALLLVASVLLSHQNVSAATAVLYVSPNGGSSGSCASWATACNLMYAVQIAPPGSEVWVNAGTYQIGPASSDSFELKNGVAIYGGFQGTETERSQRNWLKNQTVLTGDVQGDDRPDGTNVSENSFHTVKANSVDSTAVLDGFTITGGNARGSAGNPVGGGILIMNASPRLFNLVFEYNYADAGAGASCTGNSYPLLFNVTFRRNRSAGNGGGFSSNSGCNASIYGAVFTLNQAVNGGGVATSGGQLFLDNATITGNSASEKGGAVFGQTSSITLRNSILWENFVANQFNQFDSASVFSFAANNIVQGGLAGANLNADPLFIARSSSGADGVWGTVDDLEGVLELRSGSPAIDAGENAALSSQFERDIKNWPRLIDHPREDTPSWAVVDLGAHETGPLHVRQGAQGAQTGGSWADAFSHLSEALSYVKPTGEVWVAAGTYLPGSTRENTFRLQNEIAIYGGFSGTETQRDQRDPATNLSILSGNIGEPNSRLDNAYHVVIAEGVNQTAVLDGFTIRDGQAKGASAPFDRGAGLLILNSSPVLANLALVENQAQYGAGLYSSASEYQLTQAILHHNQAAYGAGLYNTGSASPQIFNITLTGNVASGSGGAMYNADGASPDVTNAIIAGNQAAAAGGVYNINNARPVLRNATIVGNQGGAFYTYNNQPGQNALLVNVIFWNNLPKPFTLVTSKPIIRSSLVEGGCPPAAFCQYVLSSSPQLARLPSSGPDLTWGTSDDDYGDLRLMSGSPAIDFGDNSGVKAGVLQDRAGGVRFYDDPVAADLGLGSSPIVDLGAYEAVFTPTTTRILSIDPPSAVTGQVVTVHFAVNSTPAGADGLVTISDGSATCSAPASAGVCELSFASIGEKSITASFSGSPLFHPSVSAALPYTVGRAQTQVSLKLAPSPSALGEKIFARFSVLPAAPGAGSPTGIVNVSGGGYTCSASVAIGGCDMDIAIIGDYTFTAEYSGDANFEGSSSSAVSHTVVEVITSIAIDSVVPAEPVVGQEITVSFTVTGARSPETGMVTVIAGDSQCQATIADGSCRLSISSAGTHNLLVVYDEEINLLSTVETFYEITVLPAFTVLSIAPPENMALVNQPAWISFELQVETPGAGSPSGWVEVRSGETFCIAAVEDGGCALSLPLGSHEISAEYLGDGNFLPDLADNFTLLVNMRIFLPTVSR